MGTVTSITDLIAAQKARAEQMREQDPGAEARAAEDVERWKRQRALEQRKQNVHGSGITVEADCLRKVVLGKLDPTHAFRVVNRWVDVHEGLVPAKTNPGRVLVLLGGKGCGKTVAAAHAIARIGGRQIHSEALTELHVSRAWSHEQALLSLMHCRLIVVDDVGTEREDLHDARSSALHALIDGRQSQNALTIITCNLPDEAALHAILDERTVSRLVQVGMLLRCKGKDLRIGDGPTKMREVGS